MKRLIYAVILALMLPGLVWAQTLVHQELGTGVVWTDPLQGDVDEDLDLVSTSPDTVTCGSYHDWGDGSVALRTTLYYIEFKLDGFSTAPAVDEASDLYISMGQTTSLFTGPEALTDTQDVQGATARLENLKFVGSIINHSVTAGDDVVGSFFVQVAAQYWAPCVHNRTANNYLATSDNHRVVVYPVYFEIQP